MLLQELLKNKELKLSGKEMELTFLDISQLKLLTSPSKIISKDSLVEIKIEMDIGSGSQEISPQEVLQVQSHCSSSILLIMQELD